MFFTYPGSKHRGNTGLFAVLAVCICCSFPDDAKAHLELYHNVEVNLTETSDTGRVRLYFTIHAPELLVGFEEAGSEIFDAEWLRTRTDAEFETLFQRARQFVNQKFGFRINSGPELDLKEGMSFEKPETIRDDTYQSGVPVACLLAYVEFEVTSEGRSIVVELKKEAGKRLLLVCTRKGAFPETHDMDTGDSVTLDLPEVPRKPLPAPVIVIENGGEIVTKEDFYWLMTITLALVLLSITLWRLKATK